MITIQIFMWAGLVFSIVIAAILVMIAFTAACESATKLWDRWKWTHEEVMRRDIGREISTQAHWFHESPDAKEALVAVGKSLSENGRYDISNVRAEWRSKTAR